MIAVRPGTVTDHDTAVEVWRASNTARRGGVPAPQEHEERLRSRLGLEGVWLLVAEQVDEIVGITSGMPARTDDGAGDLVPGLCHLSLVFVVPARWGTGVGGLLVSAALERARSEGYRRIQLWTHEDNVRAQRLYASRGFGRDGRAKPDDLGDLIGLWVRDL